MKEALVCRIFTNRFQPSASSRFLFGEIDLPSDILGTLMEKSERKLRDPEDIKKRVTGDITKLNERLLALGRQLISAAARHEYFGTPPGNIALSFFRKAVNTFRAIQILKKDGLIEESWILLRVLLEAHVNLLYFLRHDPIEMTKRYLDTSILDKLKFLREVNFFEGTPQAVDRGHWERIEADIRSKYTPENITTMKRNGFTGLAFPQRANDVGLKTMYDYCYRIASRSVHTFDPAETMFEIVVRGSERQAFLRSRKLQLDSNQNMLLGRVAFVISEAVKSHLTLELILLGLGYEKFRDHTPGLERFPQEPLSGDEASDGSFYIWRE